MMSTPCLRVDYPSTDEILVQTADWRRNVLGVAGFATPPDLDLGLVPITASMTPLLRAADGSAANRGTAEGNAADWGADDRGAADRGTAERNAADWGADDRGAADRGTAERNAADGGAADGSAANRGTAEGNAADWGADDRSAAGRICEVWRMAGDPTLELAAGPAGDVRSRHGGGVLFGAIRIRDEHGAAASAAGLSQTTVSAYRAIFEVLEKTQHPHLLRVWNYLPDINGESGGEAEGEERYRQFNAARQAAFREAGRSTVGTVPAASVLGSSGGNPLSIYFLASRWAPTMIENPRQVSAYHYPPKFGAYSPTFSRACVLPQAAGTSLFVSGTASIVGCETVHKDDVEAQTRETLTNITALLEETNRVVGRYRYSLDELRLKVYVRRASDLAAIGRVLAAVVRPVAPPVYLLADVCRRELLVEIEATGEATH